MENNLTSDDYEITIATPPERSFLFIIYSIYSTEVVFKIPKLEIQNYINLRHSELLNNMTYILSPDKTGIFMYVGYLLMDSILQKLRKEFLDVRIISAVKFTNDLGVSLEKLRTKTSSFEFNGVLLSITILSENINYLTLIKLLFYNYLPNLPKFICPPFSCYISTKKNLAVVCDGAVIYINDKLNFSSVNVTTVICLDGERITIIVDLHFCQMLNNIIYKTTEELFNFTKPGYANALMLNLASYLSYLVKKNLTVLSCSISPLKHGEYALFNFYESRKIIGKLMCKSKQIIKIIDFFKDDLKCNLLDNIYNKKILSGNHAIKVPLEVGYSHVMKEELRNLSIGDVLILDVVLTKDISVFKSAIINLGDFAQEFHVNLALPPLRQNPAN